MTTIRYGNTSLTGEIESEFDKTWAEGVYEAFFNHLTEAKLADLIKVREDLFTWRRGSAQMVLKVN
ncbi:MAG: hypothetical protein V3S64_00740, partial [bacterium]